jgi:hypothetical protein
LKYGSDEYQDLLRKIMWQGQQQKRNYADAQQALRIQQELTRKAQAHQELERTPIEPHTKCQLPECNKWGARGKNYCPEHQSNLESWLNRKAS